MSLEDLYKEKERIDKLIVEEELKAGLRFKCKGCGGIFRIFRSTYGSGEYCSSCETEIKREEKRKELEDKIVGGVVTGVECDACDLYGIVVEKNGKKFEIKAGCFGGEGDLELEEVN